MQLANGDMRRVLNLLQSTHMAYPEVSEETVYLTAGAAIPAVIEKLVKSLLNDSFKDSYTMIYQAINEFGYALCDIITEISLFVAKKDLPDAAMAFLMDRFSNIEHRLSHGVSEKLQVGALVGGFISIRHMISA
jgi:replication factor C subunit 3/5